MVRAISLAILLLLAGCGEGGRYQIAAVDSLNGVYRVDTKTGLVEVCGGSIQSGLKCLTIAPAVQ
jgi:hypothetical protein